MSGMPHAEQIDAFINDVVALVDRYTFEFDLPLASMVGVLEMVKHELIDKSLYQDEEWNDE